MHVSASRPGIFKGAVAAWEALQLWTPDHIARTASEWKVSTGNIPYADQDGGISTEMPLAGYLMMMLDIDNNGEQAQAKSGLPPGYNGTEVPAYLFDAKILYDVDFGGGEVIPVLNDKAVILNRQFMIGPEGSGSPVHFHIDAVNIAIVGRKRWFLFPPGERLWCVKPAATWMFEDYRHLPNPPIEILQEPGDIVYVPADWGHAVVNLEDSVAVAFELKFPTE